MGELVCKEECKAAGSLPLRYRALFVNLWCGAALTVAVTVEGGIKRCRFNDVPLESVRLRKEGYERSTLLVEEARTSVEESQLYIPL